jgi:hypothetical protein
VGDRVADGREWSAAAARIEADRQPLHLDADPAAGRRPSVGRAEAALGDEMPGVVGGENASWPGHVYR